MPICMDRRHNSGYMLIITCTSDLHACMHTSFRPSINSKLHKNRGRHLHSGIKT